MNPLSGNTREIPDEVTKSNPSSGKLREIPDGI
jgi:hypothetical protein